MKMQRGDGIDFQFLTDHSVDIICRAGMDRMLNYVSPASLALLGWKPEEMAGRLVDDFILPEDLPLLAAAIAAVDESATIRMYKKDGSTAWMENAPASYVIPSLESPKDGSSRCAT
jgi:PAS domain S-box-containing protein